MFLLVIELPRKCIAYQCAKFYCVLLEYVLYQNKDLETRSVFKWLYRKWSFLLDLLETQLGVLQKVAAIVSKVYQLKVSLLCILYLHKVDILVKINYLKSFSQYFGTFGCFTKFIFHHKYNEARLLVINMIYISCLTVPDGLILLEIRKYQENLKTLYNGSLVPSAPAKMNILLILAKNLKNRN